MLLYDSNRNSLGTAKLGTKFVLHAQEDLYANFLDDTRQSWSVRFDTEEQVCREPPMPPPLTNTVCTNRQTGGCSQVQCQWARGRASRARYDCCALPHA